MSLVNVQASVCVCVLFMSLTQRAMQRWAARHSAGISPWTSQPNGYGKKRLLLCVYVCVCVGFFFRGKKGRLCIVISNWVNIADCVCIQGCHGLAGFSFNPPHTLNPHRLIWHFFRVLGHQARKLCLPDRQVIMFNKIPTSLQFPLLSSPQLHSAGI